MRIVLAPSLSMKAAGRVVLVGLTATLLTAGAAALLQAPPTQPSSAPATSQPGGPVAFQPGVEIDWEHRSVRAAGRVVLREGPLEFLACFAGKEHESIVRLQASATHIYMALGLIGLASGRPPQWNDELQRYDAATGDLVDIALAWRDDGTLRTADAWAWLREREYQRCAARRPWVFAGSRVLADKTLQADRSGAGIALVDFSDSLVALSRNFTSGDAELWAECNTVEIPPVGMSVTLVIRAAAPRQRTIELDFRGDLRVDGRFEAPAEVADILNLERQLRPKYVQVIDVARALRSDRARTADVLGSLGVPAENVDFRDGATTTRPTSQSTSQPR